MAEIIRKTFRETDIAARWTGSDFAMYEAKKKGRNEGYFLDIE